MARHSHKHRRLGTLRSTTLRGLGTAVVLPLGLAAAGVAALTGTTLGEDCADGRHIVEVAASPGIAPVVAERARSVERETGSCWHAEVRVRASVDVLEDLKRGEKVSQVWVPDSSLWVRAAADAGVPIAGQAGPVATSPVVLALPSGSTEPLAGARHHVTFDDVLASGTRADPLAVGWPDPRRSAVAVAALLGLEHAGNASSTGRAELAGLMSAAVTGTGSSTARRLGGGLAVPVSEQSVWAFNVTSRKPVVAAYSSAPGSALDFPYVVLDDDPDTTRAAADLLAALRDDTGRALLAARGFRDAAGRAGTALRGVAGVDARAEVVNRPPTREDLDVARDMLGTLGRGTRMLAVVDVSGSMATTVPGTPGLTRLELAQRAAATGLSLLPETASVGLWVFSTDLGPGRDHRVVVPVADGLQQRDALTSGLAGLRPVPGGATGLYDTTLAAVRHVRATYDPDRTNAVVLLTDGANEDPSGIGLATLLHRLRAESHPRRPVPVIAVAYGPDIDAAALRAVSEVTGGATYVAVDPRDVQRVLLDAIGQRLCRPDCGLLR